MKSHLVEMPLQIPLFIYFILFNYLFIYLVMSREIEWNSRNGLK